jgi:hypothetical protein
VLGGSWHHNVRSAGPGAHLGSTVQLGTTSYPSLGKGFPPKSFKRFPENLYYFQALWKTFRVFLKALGVWYMCWWKTLISKSGWALLIHHTSTIYTLDHPGLWARTGTPQKYNRAYHCRAMGLAGFKPRARHCSKPFSSTAPSFPHTHVFRFPLVFLGLQVYRLLIFI